MTSTDKFNVYVKAYGRHFFRTALWVTVMCALLAVVLVAVPQAGELVLAQAARPAAEEAIGFWWRFFALNAASFMLAIAVWLSARLLIESEKKIQEDIARELERQKGASSPHKREVSETVEAEDHPKAEEISPGHATLYDKAREQARDYVPRQLGLSVFLILQLAAAGSISTQGYLLPTALVLIWLFVLVMGLLRIDGVEGKDLKAWWLGLLVPVIAFAAGALFWHDLPWLHDRDGVALVADLSGESAESWRQQQVRSLLFMGGSAAAACAVLLAGTWIVGQKSERWQLVVGAVASVLAIFVGLAASGVVAWTDYHWLFFVVQSSAAILYWRTLMQAPNFRVFDKIRRKVVVRPNAFDKSVPLAIISVTILLGILAAFVPLWLGWHVGAVALVLVFFGQLVLLVAWLQSRIRLSSWRQVVPASIVAVFLLGVFFLWPTDPQPALNEVAAVEKSDRVAGELPDRGGLPADGALFAVAAHGGGIRAAQYTAAFLAWLDHETGYQFSNRLVAASGASGGSVGLATWAAARAAGCRNGKAQVVDGQEVPACVHAVNQALGQDHLSPLIATGLFRDYIQFWRPPARAETLRQSVIRAAADVSHDVVPNRFDFELQRAMTDAPFALMLNTTLAGSADPYSLTTRAGMLPPRGAASNAFSSHVASSAPGNVALVTAAMHSARFPLISPKGLVAASGPAVVDGGYFDNSGIVVLRQHLLGLEARGFAHEAQRKRLVVISLDNEPISSVKPDPQTGSMNSVGEIVGTTVSARGAHGQAAWQQLCTSLGTGRALSTRPGAPLWPNCEWPSELTLSESSDGLWKRQREAQAPALGWYLSRRSADRVRSDAKLKAMAIARQFGAELKAPQP
jgi:hypothetical protein